MSGKKRRDYKAVLDAVISISPSPPRVTKVMLDFEKAVWSRGDISSQATGPIAEKTLRPLESIRRRPKEFKGASGGLCSPRTTHVI